MQIPQLKLQSRMAWSRKIVLTRSNAVEQARGWVATKIGLDDILDDEDGWFAVSQSTYHKNLKMSIGENFRDKKLRTSWQLALRFRHPFMHNYVPHSTVRVNGLRSGALGISILLSVIVRGRLPFCWRSGCSCHAVQAWVVRDHWCFWSAMQGALSSFFQLTIHMQPV